MKIFEVEYNVCDKAYYMGVKSGYCQTKRDMTEAESADEAISIVAEKIANRAEKIYLQNVPDWCFEAKEAFVNVETGDDTLYYRDFKALQVRGIK